MSNAVASVRTFSLKDSADTPYLGPVREGEVPNSKGYFVRAANGTVYPVFDRTVVVRIETATGIVGWGETYGLVAPGAVGAIIGDLLSDFLIGRDPTDPSAIYDDLYDLMRVRGYTGGFYVDALAAIDIALWDIAGKIEGQPVKELLGGAERDKIPAYFSGLPKATIAAALGARARVAVGGLQRLQIRRARCGRRHGRRTRGIARRLGSECPDRRGHALEAQFRRSVGPLARNVGMRPVVRGSARPERRTSQDWRPFAADLKSPLRWARNGGRITI